MPFLVPLHVPAAVLRDLKLAARPREGNNIDLRPSGFVGKIGQPSAIGRELAIILVDDGNGGTVFSPVRESLGFYHAVTQAGF